MVGKVQTTKYKGLSPEEYNENTSYSFSYNSEEQPLFDKFYSMKLNNLRDWSEQQKNILTGLKYSVIDVILEISSKGRFHYHGYIQIKDIPRFVIHDLAKLRHYGTYEIDTIKDYEKWDKYILKQERFMRKYCNTNDMYYNIKNM